MYYSVSSDNEDERPTVLLVRPGIGRNQFSTSGRELAEQYAVCANLKVQWNLNYPDPFGHDKFTSVRISEIVRITETLTFSPVS